MKTFTQLVGTTDTTSSTSYPESFTTLSNNNSTQNVALGKSLVNTQHRYLIQKYFDNERTVTLSTVGAQSLTTTAVIAIGGVSATLTAVWAYPSCTQLVNFSGSQQRTVVFTYNSTAITWSVGLLTATTTTAITTVGVQNYSIPADVSKIKNNTISVGQLTYQPVPINTVQEWETINNLPYTSDIPSYFFIFNGTIQFFPIPSSTGNIITFNYKGRVADLSFTDYSTGTLATAGMVVGSTTVTGLASSWVTTGAYPTGTDISYYNLAIRANPPFGDGIWYPIQSFTSNTVLTLGLPVINAPNITSSTTYTIGQLPVLSEDFHDMLIYGSLKTYFTSIVSDANRFKEYATMYQERLDLLEQYAGTKQVNVDLGVEPQMTNPNLFMFSS